MPVTLWRKTAARNLRRTSAGHRAEPDIPVSAEKCRLPGHWFCVAVWLLTASLADTAVPACQPAQKRQQSPDKPHPLSSTERMRLKYVNTELVRKTTKQIQASPNDLSAVSARGDALFFLGRYKEALKDYDRMTELDPRTDRSHWRRGIAFFYAKDFKRSAAQFERYHSFDNVDRENGIWRYFAQVRLYGKTKARDTLLRYKKDDREPFPDVYKLFAGKRTPDEILEKIKTTQLTKRQRDQRLFYAELYIGLNHAVDGKSNAAKRHLRQAVANTWPRSAGYGPNYMWHVGRLELNRLRKARQPPAAPKNQPSSKGVNKETRPSP